MDLIEELTRRAAQGDANAQYELAIQYMGGSDVEEDPARAAGLLEQAAEQGHMEAAYHLGACYQRGYGVQQDLKTAYQLYLRAGLQGYGKGLNQVGDFYAEGIGVRQSWREAIKWYLDAAATEDPAAVGYAEYRLAGCLAEGHGVQQDVEAAQEWYRKALEHGEERAQEALERLGAAGAFHIREARLPDAEAIRRISAEAMGYDCAPEAAAGQLRRVLENPAHKVFVAVSGGAVVGYVHGADYDVLYGPPMKQILGLAVPQEHRSQGMGKALLERLEGWAKDTGAAGIRLNSGAERTGAHAFYLRCGYQTGKTQIKFIKKF